jgi:type IV fimbrial biogenesis protein FimT
MGRPAGQAGFTLAELLVALAVAGILLVGATSLLPRFVQEARMVTEVNHLASALALARSEAVTRARRMVLCPSHDGQHCGSSRDWPSGWLLFASDDTVRDPGEPLLQAGSPTGPGITVHGSNRRRTLVFQPDGSSGGSNTSFTFCDARHHARPRVICLSNTGRARLARHGCGGQPAHCP